MNADVIERIWEQQDGKQPSEASPGNTIRLVPQNIPGLGFICYGDRGAWLRGLADPVVLGLSRARQDPAAKRKSKRPEGPNPPRWSGEPRDWELAGRISEAA